jgi:hypothetical protein
MLQTADRRFAMERSLKHVLLALLVCGPLSFVCAHAVAQDHVAQNHVAMGYDDPIAIDIGMGPAIGLGKPTAFQMRESVSYHFSGSDEGFHLGGALGQIFVPGDFIFEVGPRIGYDVKFVLDHDLALGIDPFLTVGMGFFTGVNGPPDTVAFQVSPGVDVKLFVGGTFYAFARPLAFDFLVRDDTWVFYDLLFGAGVRL